MKTRARRVGIEALIYSLAAVGIAAFAYCAGQSQAPPERADVLGPYSLIRVLSRVEGVQGPAVQVGHDFELQGELCVKGTRGVSVRTEPHLRKLGDGGVLPPIDYPASVVIREAGCHVVMRRVPLPPPAVPGSYIAYARDVVEATGEELTWQSEPFQVLP